MTTAESTSRGSTSSGDTGITSTTSTRTTGDTTGDTSGGDTSGGDTSGGDTTGWGTSGGDTSGGDTTGWGTSGGDTSGGDTTGGGTSGDALDCVAVDEDEPGSAWSRRLGDGSQESIDWPDLAVDPGGASLISGLFQGTLDLGLDPVSNDTPAQHYFVAKYEVPCAPAWVITSEGEGEGVEERSMAVDSAGNVFVAGSFSGTLDVGGEVLEATYGIELVRGHLIRDTTDLFLVKYAPDGTLLWARRFGDDVSQTGFDIAITDEDEPVVVGSFRGTVDFGNAIVTGDESRDGLIVHFSADGEHLWSKTFSAPADVNIFVVDLSSGGLISIFGMAAAGVDFGGGALAVDGTHFAYLAQFEPSGEHRWSRRTLTGYDTRSIATDDAGAVYTAGRYQEGVWRAFVVKFDPEGELGWLRLAGTTYGYGRDIALTAEDDIEVVGDYEGVLDFGGGAIESATSNGFAVRFDPEGAVLSADQVVLGDESTYRPSKIAHGAQGERVAYGVLRGTAALSGGPLTSVGLKLNPVLDRSSL